MSVATPFCMPCCRVQPLICNCLIIRRVIKGRLLPCKRRPFNVRLTAFRILKDRLLENTKAADVAITNIDGQGQIIQKSYFPPFFMLKSNVVWLKLGNDICASPAPSSTSSALNMNFRLVLLPS